MVVRLPLAGFWLFLCILHISPYLCFFWYNFKSFLGYQYQNYFFHCYEHLLCNLHWPWSLYKIKQGFVFIFSNKSILEQIHFKSTCRYYYHLWFYFLCFATYVCCHLCFIDYFNLFISCLIKCDYTKMLKWSTLRFVYFPNILTLYFFYAVLCKCL